ncbi:hypothetical protein GCM10023094_54970 [Rhodococcus olei]|uniref:Uncharacterized protein n=1 Tax=Rhodococcus olei TaxID=2161675 RepID=A0ABP8PS39_9NOCA
MPPTRLVSAVLDRAKITPAFAHRVGTDREVCWALAAQLGLGVALDEEGDEVPDGTAHEVGARPSDRIADGRERSVRVFLGEASGSEVDQMLFLVRHHEAVSPVRWSGVNGFSGHHVGTAARDGVTGS